MADQACSAVVATWLWQSVSRDAAVVCMRQLLGIHYFGCAYAPAC